MIRGPVFLSLCVTLLSGCGGDDSLPAEARSAETIRSETVRGPVTLVVELAPEQVRLSDEPTLTLTIQSAPGIDVTTPPFGEALGEFLIRNYQDPPSTSEGGRDVTRLIYTLEPTRAGTLTIDPIRVTFRDNRPSGDGKEYAVESEALIVEVTTVLGESAPSLDNLKPSAGPVELDSSGPPFWAWIVFGLVIAAACLLIWLKYRNRRLTPTEPPLTPQQLAHRELNQIVSRRLNESDLKVFYVEVTAVVRRYIERTTGVKAAEQTTEEFLREIVSGTIFQAEEQRRLKQFLESADLVKFAGHQPEPDDVHASIKRAREFIQLSPGASEEPNE